MGSSTGSLLVDREEDLRRVFEVSPGAITVRSEDDAIIARALVRVREEHPVGVDASFHPVIRDREVCFESTWRTTRVAKEREGAGASCT